MALDQIAAREPSETYARINAAISALNTLLGQVDGKASREALNDVIAGLDALRKAIDDEAKARFKVDDEIKTKSIDDVKAIYDVINTEIAARFKVDDEIKTDLIERFRLINEALGTEIGARFKVDDEIKTDLIDKVRLIYEALTQEAVTRFQVAESIQASTTFRFAQTDNDIFDLSNKLSGLADQISTEVTRLTLSTSAAFMAAVIAGLDGLRPGIFPSAFTASALGSFSDSPELPEAGAFLSSLGRAYRIDGPGLIAPRAAVLVDPDAVRVLRVRYWREVDVSDPNNNAVDVGVQWLDSAGAGVGTTLLRREMNLRAKDGPQSLTTRVPSLPGDKISITPPHAAVSWRPYLRTYGSGGSTAVERIGVSDATFAGVFAPDVSALSDRIGTLEGQIAAGVPFTTPILPSYPVAELPRVGSRGRKAFASDGRAPNAAGGLEAANAGTGVEVIDNGTAWVISGTNQAVQA